MAALPTHVERIEPILCVSELERALRYYTDVLGFERAPWRTENFTSVALAGHGLYLAENLQGQPGAWVWIGVVEDPDGNVLRFGSDPE